MGGNPGIYGIRKYEQLQGGASGAGATIADLGTDTADMIQFQALVIPNDDSNGVVTSTGSFTTMVKLQGTATDGILISGACTDAIHISGTNTVNAIHISGDQAVAMLVDVDAALATGISFAVDNGITMSTGIDITCTGTGTVTNAISITYSNSATEVIALTVATGKTITTGMSMSGAGTWTTGILLDATAITTGISISAGSMTDAIKISGTTPVDGLEISSACSANAINLSGGSATQLSISGAFTTGISIAADGTTGLSVTNAFSGANMISLAGTGSNAAILISGACGKGIEITGSCTTGIGILTGTYTTGLSIAGTTTTSISISAPVTAGISMPGGAAYNPIHIGVKSNTADAGLILTGVTDDTGGIMVFCDDGGDALANITSPIWTRYLVTVSQSGGATATGLYAQIKNLAATFTTGSYTALKAFYQCGGATTLAGSAEMAVINAGISFEGNLTNTLGTLSGVDININDGGYTIGTHSGLIIRKTASSTLGWTTGITISDAGAVTGIAIGTTTTGMTVAACTTGISITTVTTGISVTGTGATASAKAFTSSGFTLNNGNLTDGYGILEADLTLTGTVAGMVAASSSWVNMGTVTIGANWVCAQTNGLWSGASGVLTNGVFIFGMRAQCLLQTNGGAGGATFYPFSVVNNTNITSAIFKCNDASSDLGRTTNAGVDSGLLVPLYTDNSGTKYVKLYTLA